MNADTIPRWSTESGAAGSGFGIFERRTPYRLSLFITFYFYLKHSGKKAEAGTAFRRTVVLEPYPFYRHSKIEPPAPVSGGGRWRARYHDVMELCRRDRGLTVHDPDAPIHDETDPEMPDRCSGPHIVSAPPPEARVGAEYVYHARAYDSGADGFTWYFEKSLPGMRIDRHSGAMTWTPAKGGYVEVIVCARSVFGAVSRQSWTLCVRKTPAVRAPAINRRFRDAVRRLALREARRPPPRFCWREGWSPAGVDRRATSPPRVRLRGASPLRR